MNYNPYDLVTVRIEGEEVHGRPYQFDSDPTNQETMQNSFGNYVKPTHISTICPKCGQGIMIENIRLPDPPFPTIEWSCQNCRPGAIPPLVNAFMNPLEAGRIAEHELDPLLHNPMEQVSVNASETVADRLGHVAEQTQETVVLDKPKPAKKKRDRKPASKQPEPVQQPEPEPEPVQQPEPEPVAQKLTEGSGKRSPIKGAPMLHDAAKNQPEPTETASLTTKTRVKKELEPAEGINEEFVDDDLVEDE